ncbi:hypothetical protein [Streptomyces heilongjiangensis]|uniref:LPXTG cell wall anchor domain-containing protein n=1 Tax=Streptomyces heilongjiangensis TaxID=945052 RepID=A0ABW1B061_9ACTN|nr:hypothetical protein [Streptomyces heilongjiangensis]MDC2946529.1 hypothetical protein [Streptomyces heilongjiangensis]
MTGRELTGQGASPWWPMTAGGMVVLSLHGLYRIRRDSPQSRS